MRIIKARDLKDELNGTVYSDITDKHFLEYDGDVKINGLNILYGHDQYCPVGKSFNGVLHMLNYVTCEDQQPIYTSDKDWLSITDTAMCDYEKDEYVVIYDKHEVCLIIKNLLRALEIYGDE